MSTARGTHESRGSQEYHKRYHEGSAGVPQGSHKGTQGYYMGHTRGTKSSNIRVLQGLPQGYHRSTRKVSQRYHEWYSKSTTKGSTELPRVIQQGYRMGQTRVLQEVTQEVTYEAQGCYNKDGHKGTTRDATEVPSGYHSGLIGITCIYHKEYH